MPMKLHQAKFASSKTAANVRREMLDGRQHIVVPVVMIVDGVLNGGLVTQEEYGRFVEAWNGRPVPVLHPQDDAGNFLSANRPDVLQKNCIGWVFNAKADGGKLCAELWIDPVKAKRLGYDKLVAALEAGQIVEVSTGYFTDAETVSGEFNGVPYTEIHRNIRPDHLALLPGEIGACSVADGCGTRVNSQEGVKMAVQKALAFLANLANMRANKQCKCEDASMKPEQIAALKARAEKLKANGKITPEQFAMISEADPEQLAMMAALIDAFGTPAAAPAVPPEDMADKGKPATPPAAAPAAAPSADEIATMVDKRVTETLRRRDVVANLKANEANPFSDAEMNTLPVETLERVEQSIRPVDYSGAGGVVHTNARADGSKGADVLHLNRGVLARDKKTADKGAGK
jgi:hypothetical protein